MHTKVMRIILLTRKQTQVTNDTIPRGEYHDTTTTASRWERTPTAEINLFPCMLFRFPWSRHFSAQDAHEVAFVVRDTHSHFVSHQTYRHVFLISATTTTTRQHNHAQPSSSTHEPKLVFAAVRATHPRQSTFAITNKNRTTLTHKRPPRKSGNELREPTTNQCANR